MAKQHDQQPEQPQQPPQQAQAQQAQAQQAPAQQAPAQTPDAELQSSFDSALEWTNDVTSTFFSVSVIAALTTSLARSVWKK